MDLTLIFNAFMADLLVVVAVLFAWTSAKHDSFKSFFLSIKDREFYYLSFIHEYALEELLSGVSEDEIAIRIKTKKFAFLLDRTDEDRKTREAKNMVEHVISREDLLKAYIIKKRFEPKDFSKLKTALNSDDKKTKALSELMSIIVDKEQVERYMSVFVELHTPPFRDGVKSTGENEMYIMDAAKDLKIISKETTDEKFAKCMIKLQECYPKMRVISGKQGLGYHRQKTIDTEKIKSRMNVFLEEINRSPK